MVSNRDDLYRLGVCGMYVCVNKYLKGRAVAIINIVVHMAVTGVEISV